MPGVSGCAGFLDDSRLSFPTTSPSASRNSIGAPDEIDFAAQYPACLCPCQRFTCHLAMTDTGLGVRTVRYSFSVGLSHSLLPAGLSRRTACPFAATMGLIPSPAREECLPGPCKTIVATNGHRVEKRRAMGRSIGFRCIRPFEPRGKEPPDPAYVSSSPSKIPYGGFSPVRLQTGFLRHDRRQLPASLSVRSASATQG